MTHSISHHPVGENAEDEGLPAEINYRRDPVGGISPGLIFCSRDH